MVGCRRLKLIVLIHRHSKSFTWRAHRRLEIRVIGRRIEEIPNPHTGFPFPTAFYKHIFDDRVVRANEISVFIEDAPATRHQRPIFWETSAGNLSILQARAQPCRCGILLIGVRVIDTAKDTPDNIGPRIEASHLRRVKPHVDLGTFRIIQRLSVPSQADRKIRFLSLPMRCDPVADLHVKPKPRICRGDDIVFFSITR